MAASQRNSATPMNSLASVFMSASSLLLAPDRGRALRAARVERRGRHGVRDQSRGLERFGLPVRILGPEFLQGGQVCLEPRLLHDTDLEVHLRVIGAAQLRAPA